MHWQKNIHDFQPKVCEILAQPEEMNKSIAVIRRIAELQRTIYNTSSFSSVDQHLSEFYYQLSCPYRFHSSVLISHKIEPLVGLTRDPLTMCPNSFTIPTDLDLQEEYAVQSKRFLLLGPSAPTSIQLSQPPFIPTWLSDTRPNMRTPQIILFDIGSSYFNSVDGAQPGPHIGSRWFYEYFKSKSIVLDRIIAFEHTPLTPRTAWEQLPSDILPMYTLINVGVEEKGKFNPWRVLQAIAKPHDYVLVKLDIDHDALEHALIRQLMASQKLQALIDELFYEMHVTVPAMHKYWGAFRNSTLKDVYQLFTRLRAIGIRMHSWP